MYTCFFLSRTKVLVFVSDICSLTPTEIRIRHRTGTVSVKEIFLFRYEFEPTLHLGFVVFLPLKPTWSESDSVWCDIGKKKSFFSDPHQNGKKEYWSNWYIRNISDSSRQSEPVRVFICSHFRFTILDPKPSCSSNISPHLTQFFITSWRKNFCYKEEYYIQRGVN